MQSVNVLPTFISQDADFKAKELLGGPEVFHKDAAFSSLVEQHLLEESDVIDHKNAHDNPQLDTATVVDVIAANGKADPSDKTKHEQHSRQESDSQAQPLENKLSKYNQKSQTNSVNSDNKMTTALTAKVFKAETADKDKLTDAKALAESEQFMSLLYNSDKALSAAAINIKSGQGTSSAINMDENAVKSNTESSTVPEKNTLTEHKLSAFVKDELLVSMALKDGETSGQYLNEQSLSNDKLGTPVIKSASVVNEQVNTTHVAKLTEFATTLLAKNNNQLEASTESALSSLATEAIGKGKLTSDDVSTLATTTRIKSDSVLSKSLLGGESAVTEHSETTDTQFLSNDKVNSRTIKSEAVVTEPTKYTQLTKQTELAATALTSHNNQLDLATGSALSSDIDIIDEGKLTVDDLSPLSSAVIKKEFTLNKDLVGSDNIVPKATETAETLGAEELPLAEKSIVELVHSLGKTVSNKQSTAVDKPLNNTAEVTDQALAKLNSAKVPSANSAVSGNEKLIDVPAQQKSAIIGQSQAYVQAEAVQQEQVQLDSSKQQETGDNGAEYDYGKTTLLTPEQSKEPGVTNNVAKVTDNVLTRSVAEMQTQAIQANQDKQYNDAYIEYQSSEVLNHNVATDTAQIQKNNVQLQQETLSIFKKDFADAVKDKVLLTINQKLQQFDITLDPPEFGNMQVRVNLQGEQAAVSFVVQNQQAKEALEQNMPKLKEMLAEQGVDVGGATVEQQDQQSNKDENSLAQNKNSSSLLTGQDEEDNVQHVLSAKLFDSSATGVDYYA